MHTSNNTQMNFMKENMRELFCNLRVWKSILTMIQNLETIKD